MVYLESYLAFFSGTNDIFATARSIASLTGFLNIFETDTAVSTLKE